MADSWAMKKIQENPPQPAGRWVSGGLQTKAKKRRNSPPKRGVGPLPWKGMLEAPRADSEALSALRENRSGSYFATHRVLDPETGRWTTPDPAMSPWKSLFDYVLARPTLLTDPTGLTSVGHLGGSIPSIPGAPGKWGGAYVNPEALDLLRAWAQVLAIISGKWGGYGFPFFGGAKYGLIQGWTYYVTDSGKVYLKPWHGDWLDEDEGADDGSSGGGVPPPETGKCRKVKDDWDSTKHRKENTSGLNAAEFCWQVYREVEKEQNANAAQAGAAKQNFRVVLSCDENGATFGTGYCTGNCPGAQECLPNYAKHKKRWLDRGNPLGDLINDVAGGVANDAVALRTYWEMIVLAKEPLMMHQIFQTKEFATDVSCDCR